MTLKQFLTHWGKPKFGAASRVAEALGVSLGTVTRWRDGERKPGVKTARKLQQVLRDGLDLRPKKRTKAIKSPCVAPR